MTADGKFNNDQAPPSVTVSDMRLAWLRKPKNQLIVRDVRYKETGLGIPPIVVKHISGETSTQYQQPRP